MSSVPPVVTWLLAALAVVLTLLLVVDILRRRRLAARLCLLEDAYRALHMGLNIWELEDRDDPSSLRLVLSNPGAMDATGVPTESVLGKTIVEGFPEAVQRGIAQVFADVALSGQPKDMGEVVWGDARMREGYFAVYAFPLPGRRVGVTFENITKRKLADMEAARKAFVVDVIRTVAVAANAARTPADALRPALEEVSRLTGWEVGHALARATDHDRPALITTGIWHVSNQERFESFRAATEPVRFEVGMGLPGGVLASGRPQELLDFEVDPARPRKAAALATGLIAGYAFPVLVGAEVVGALEFFSTRALMLDAKLRAVLDEISGLLAQVFERHRGSSGRP